MMTALIIASTTQAARGVRAEEPRPAALLVRVVAEPDDRERDEAAQHADREQVLEEPDRRPVADPRDRERAREQVPVRLDDRQQQDDEAPEGRRVGRPRHRPLQQLPLPDHLGQLGLHVRRRDAPRAYATRSGAGCPENASRFSHHTRRPAMANAATVSTRPTIIRKTTRNLLRYLGVKRNGVTSDTQERTASGGSRWAAPGRGGRACSAPPAGKPRAAGNDPAITKVEPK